MHVSTQLSVFKQQIRELLFIHRNTKINRQAVGVVGPQEIGGGRELGEGRGEKGSNRLSGWMRKRQWVRKNKLGVAPAVSEGEKVITHPA